MDILIKLLNKPKLIEHHKNSNEAGRKELEEIFGKETFAKNFTVPTDIESHEDACKYLGRDPNALPDVSMRPEYQRAAIIAAAKLMDISEALNKLDNNFQASYLNKNQPKWYPRFDASKSFAFSYSYYIIWCSDSDVGSRLCYRFRSEATANHFGKQFNDLHKQSFYL